MSLFHITLFCTLNVYYHGSEPQNSWCSFTILNLLFFAIFLFFGLAGLQLGLLL